MQRFFLEGYGCSLNISETEQQNGFLRAHGFIQVNDFTKADFVIINTCSVKHATEQRMLSRIKYFLEHKRPDAKLIVTGCLPAAQKESVIEISKEIIALDTKLSSLCNALGIRAQDFSPEITPVKSKELVSIIPISIGCLNSCAFCSTKLARAVLHSYSVESILKSFRRAINSGSKEIWLTSQDAGCYGFDINTNLPVLLKELLQVSGNYRIRVGMMNPQHFKKIKKDLLPLFKDEKLFKFLHLPVQSGSDTVLKSMRRGHSVKDFIDAAEYARKIIPNMHIATDIIVGFPTEKEEDFKKTIDLIKKVKPETVNVSRFAKRTGTLAEKMVQLRESVKKKRSEELVRACEELFLKENKKYIGKELDCFVCEKTKNGFNAHTNSYRTVFVDSGYGRFVRVKIIGAEEYFLKGKIVEMLS